LCPMKPVPGRFWTSLAWRIHGEGTSKVLPSTGSAGSMGWVIRRLNTVSIVWEIIKMGQICTRLSLFLVVFGLVLVGKSMGRVPPRFRQVLEAPEAGDGPCHTQLQSKSLKIA